MSDTEFRRESQWDPGDPDSVMTEENGIIIGSVGPCSMCGRPTRYADIFSHGHFCSGKCLNDFYDWMNEWANAPFENPDEEGDDGETGGDEDLG